jgi:hypothetical protein
VFEGFDEVAVNFPASLAGLGFEALAMVSDHRGRFALQPISGPFVLQGREWIMAWQIQAAGSKTTSPLRCSVVQLQLLELRLDDVAAIRVLGLVLVVVVLVVVFRRVEGVCGGDFGDDGRLEMRLGKGLGGGRGGDLLGAVGENGGAVLGAGVVPLAIQGGGVVEIPKPGEDFLVGDFFRIEDDLDDFCMAGISVADLGVGRIFHRATHVAGSRGVNPVELAVGGLDAPKAACT